MDLEQLPNLAVYRRSVVEAGGCTFLLARGEGGKVLGVQGDTARFEGVPQGEVLLCPLTAGNAAALRERIPWLRPQLLGLNRSVGCGDRLGRATAGHIRAVRNAVRQSPAQGTIALIPAQQSMRENARTGRSPQQVLDDAMWGVFQEGWREPWGADADHLKTIADVDLCVAAGYTFYTVDPGDRVDNEAHTASLDALEGKLQALPWSELEDSLAALQVRYLGPQFEVEGMRLSFDRTTLARAAAKYGRAIAHTATLYRHLASAMGSRPFEFEVSVDETETPTSALEHYFIASELKRLGVRWVSLAPRYVGRFEKGVDYIGDLGKFEAELAKHAAVARVLGPYKLSIHSGSDKFSVYPIFARQAGELIHLKTAGTSYLDAVRTISRVEPGFFREMLALALERYESDRATYHVSADPAKVPLPEELSDDQLGGVLDQFDGREVLHVTFGSVLDRFGVRLLAALDAHEEEYYAALEANFERHLAPFLN
jgi:hypothetical protein